MTHPRTHPCPPTPSAWCIRVRSFVEASSQTLALEFNLRTVSCTISSAFPTPEGVAEAVSLAKRAGLKASEGVVIGIGSGAAIDLARAVSASLFHDADSVDSERDCRDGVAGGSTILAPCTLGGLWATSVADGSLLLDTKEEALLPSSSRRGSGDVVIMDSSSLALPPLYAPFPPATRGGYSPAPSMAHFAAAGLAVVLDVARVEGMVADQSGRALSHVARELEAAAASFAAVLTLAAEANNGSEVASDHAQSQRLLDAMCRVSALVEPASHPASTTVPQTLAHALLPAHFPQYHIVTYMGSILPGLCEALAADSGPTTSINNVAEVILKGDRHEDSLSSWASRVAAQAGIPPMASLAFCAPAVETLADRLNSYGHLIASSNSGKSSALRRHDCSAFANEVLERSLNR